MGAEAAAVRLGQVLATRAVRLWLGPRRRDQESRSDLSELIRFRVPGLRAQRDLIRQFEQIADAVAARVQPLLEHEFRGLAPSDRQAALDAVADTFARADLSDEAVIGSDADPAELARRIRSAAPVPAGFDEATTAFHELLFSQTCDCYVRLLRRLPVFTERAVTELLARSTSLATEISLLLERLPAPQLYAPQGEGQDEAFRREYLEFVSRSLDEVELFSFASERAARTKLSVAYVSLRTSAEARGRTRGTGSVPRARAGDWLAEEDGHGVRVETALKGTDRVLLRGEAGSGKTTLLQWLAVSAARGAFNGELGDWNGLVPALVKLRRYAGRDLPAPEALLDHTAGPLTGHLPRAWMDRQLRDGRVLLLVDGLDELPANERRPVRDWLGCLLKAYPGNRVVVTSRPAAARADWLRHEGFKPVLLDRMRPADVVVFVRKWHQAVLDQGEDLAEYERALLASLQDRPHLQSLASSPLLAALLCALHLNRGRQLPRDRMELYRIALEILLQRRDAERNVPSALDVPLSLTDKMHVLQDLAWRLSDNNRSEISEAQALAYTGRALSSMRHLDGVRPEAVLDHLLTRSGVLRKPTEDRVDFLHRTFQEYLAAADAAAEDNIGNLVERAHLDLWRDTIVMAAGHATRSQRTELIRGVLARAADEPRHRRRLRLLAVACLETMSSVPEAIAGSLDAAMDDLIPPRRREESASLATAGPPLLRRMPASLEGFPAAAAGALARTAAIIGGEQAFGLLERWAEDSRSDVLSEVAAVWDYFPVEEYAQRVLRKLPLAEVPIELSHPAQIPAAARLREIRQLYVFCRLRQGLSPLAGLLTELRALHLFQAWSVTDLDPLASCTRLRTLFLANAHDVDVSSLAQLPDLEFLGLFAHPRPGARVSGPTDLSGLVALRAWYLSGFDLSAWLPTITCAPSRLTHLSLARSVVPEDLGGLAVFGQLETLDLQGAVTADGRRPDLDSVPEGIRVAG
ncbi:NACHT domain-containing protein [Streptomyces antimicrobicus]|uniref:NACHT domain-containing protein n=1 Tax=Streptomyces antimicrobicus TaxID=2883108 RepID=A0ABS8BF46_9ACTN|nr:NACHT domain-containing protein [Streptomyces antimicrobicus]MCB5183252.1 NACHT domain-containing protein [Streptomyces antimicrobicus]